jgi:hypothetical protein
MSKASLEMSDNRITFLGNPWPAGHPILEFKWLAGERNGQVWFDLHLKTAEYDSERSIDGDEDVEYSSDWEAPVVWNNYHACTLSSNYWHDGGFPVGDVGNVSLEFLDGMEVSVDSPAPEDPEDNAFNVYLLGHDAAAHHRIKFARIPGTDRFNIHWVGKLALTYVGDYEYKHDFEARIFNVQAPDLPGA